MKKDYKDLEEWIEDGNSDVFDKHIATRIDLPTGKNDCYIHFENPEDSNGWMDFIYCNGTLTIQGDYGNCSLCWHNKNNHIEALAGFASNMGYFLSKLESAERSSIPHRYMLEFDQDLCIKEVHQHFIENEQEIDEEEFENWEWHTESHHTWVNFIMNNGEKFFNGDYDFSEYGYDFGQYLHGRTYLWCYGLIKAIEFLEKK